MKFSFHLLYVSMGQGCVKTMNMYPPISPHLSYCSQCCHLLDIVSMTTKIAWLKCTLMACPKQPFPSTSPWMRSDGRKMRCVRFETTRSDSERLMSFLCEMGDAALLEPGDLSML